MTPKAEKKPSFLKCLLAGEIREDLIFPYPSVEADEAENLKLFTETVEKWATEHVDGEKFDREGEIPATVIQQMAELGILGITTPEAYEGFGFSNTAFCRVMELLGSIEGNLTVLFGAHASLGTKPLVLFGSEEQKKRFLPDLAIGQRIGAFCLTEAGAGSDAGSIKTTATLSPDGKYYFLNGSKLFVTNGSIAGLYSVFAQTEVEKEGEKKQRISCFVVPRETEGLSIGKHEDKMGIRGTSTTEIVFDNVKVPVENLVGGLGKGFRIALDILDYGRLGLAAGCLGATKAIIRTASEYANTRHQFGQPIANFEIIQEKISDMVINSYAVESMVYLTSALADRGDVDFALEAACCKIMASDLVWKAADEALQIAGGYGYIRDYPYERFLRDARINQIFEGTNEILHVFITLMGIRDYGDYLTAVGKAMKKPLTSLGTLSEFLGRRIKRKFSTPHLTKVHPALRPSAQLFEQNARRLYIKVEKALMRYGRKIMEKEFVQKRISEVTIDLFAMAATLSRTDSAIRQKGLENTKGERTLCTAFRHLAAERIHRHLNQFPHNIDNLRREISQEVYRDNTYKWNLI